MENEKDSSNFSIGKSAQERGMSHIPECYVLLLSERLSQGLTSENLMTIDIGRLHGTNHDRSVVVEEIGKACRQMGFFQVINHGICQKVLDEALHAESSFFDLPNEHKAPFMSNDVNKPVRYGTSLKDGLDRVQFWRVFLKHYAHPLEQWIESWPSKPTNYRETMGRYAVEVMRLSNELTGAITESPGLGPKYLDDKMEKGLLVMAVNCYPPCPQPDLTLGLPPHSDYSCITVLLQSCPGLQIKPSPDGKWIGVPEINGALQIHVGDHFEVLRNGLYMRSTVNSENTRISIASLHSLGMDVKMETAKELIDEEHPKGYMESSFRDFLNFLSDNDIANGNNFIDSLKMRDQ
ncbi:hypothetical protein AQUCO_05300035v1 [Aquilegia coerulea]|uniref:Fe2OG dioxygenase domain-containing protein n=1 Tax=Aquilegia coerulea TaxID=218851 RepID=A0A2G5CI51_AQUCA|nr:hypothetical protein AQUCO_05300035v1 [Aquilegia coerulea]